MPRQSRSFQPGGMARDTVPETPLRRGPNAFDPGSRFLDQKKKKAKPLVKARKRGTDILYLDAVGEDDETTFLYCKLMFKLADQSKIIKIKSGKELAEQIKKHSPIGHLIISTHGDAGWISLSSTTDTDDYELDSPKLQALFTRDCLKKIKGAKRCPKDAVFGSKFCPQHQPEKPEPWFGPRIGEITIKSCIVGQRPDQVAAFARLFHAEKISAYTWYTAANRYKISFPKGTTQREVETRLERMLKYFAPGNPTPADIARVTRSGTFNGAVLLLWYQKVELSGGQQPDLPPGVDDKSDLNRGHFRAQADVKTIDSTETAKKLKELEKSHGLEMPCEKIVINMKY